MPSEKKEIKSFLSWTKASIYIAFFLLGLAFKLLHWPGNFFMLFGSGLLLGHFAYRSVVFPGQLLLRIFSLLMLTSAICALILAKFNVPPASLTCLVAFGVSLVIERFTK